MYDNVAIALVLDHLIMCNNEFLGSSAYLLDERLSVGKGILHSALSNHDLFQTFGTFMINQGSYL